MIGARSTTLMRPPGSCTNTARADPLQAWPDDVRATYVCAIETLRDADVEFLIGGALAFACYTGIIRDTKDLDVFLRRRDCEEALDALSRAGFSIDMTFPHWLAKAYAGDRYIDLIYGSGNGVASVDDLWFSHSHPAHVLGVPVRLCPPEEMIWSKAFIMERERYDGADVAHIILACGRQLDWGRLIERFGQKWRVLLSHLILFGFIYPGERSAIPEEVVDNLLHRLEREQTWPKEESRVCDGTLLSRQQYLPDLSGGYADGRLVPRGDMTAAEIALWTAAIFADPTSSPSLPAEAASPNNSRLSHAHLNGRTASRARRRRR
jgi:hypothetical protein